jgi:hypothetical protein
MRQEPRKMSKATSTSTSQEEEDLDENMGEVREALTISCQG